MTAQTNQPAKFLVPFAQNDSSRVELPVTTTDATRASQSAGFPPLTMQPPESGGVPPQGEDFNGAMNQVARIAWWLMLGGRFGFDNAFATATQIGGYPKGAVLQSADFLGGWVNTTDNNTTNPDTTTDPAGGGYVPGYQYGTTALTGLTGGTVTLTNAQAAKNAVTLAGALTSALTIVVPTWLKQWSITNNTTGAFTTTIKTAAGTGIAIPQNGAPTTVGGDGTNIIQPPQNIANATQSQQPVAMGQLYGALKGIARYTSSGTFTAPVTGPYYFSGCGGGSGGGGGGGTVGAASSVGGGGGSGGGAGQAILRQVYNLTAGQVLTITIGAGGGGGTAGQGTGTAGGNGGAGGATTVSAPVSLTLGGAGAGLGGAGMNNSGAAVGGGGAGGQGTGGYPSGNAGGDGNFAGLGGMGASSPFGGGGGGGRAATATISAQNGNPAAGYGGGGGGGGASYGNNGAQAAGTGGAAGGGYLEIEW